MGFNSESGVLSLGPDDVRRLRDDLGLAQFPNATFSALFCAQLHAMQLAGVLADTDVLDEVAALEGQRASSNTKGAEQFEDLPLRGLWHKHFFTARNMPRNLMNQWRKRSGSDDWLGAQMTRLFEESESGFVDQLLINKIAAVAVDGAYQARHAQRELTGHWIIFAKHDRRRYYLSIVSHSRSREDDKPVHRAIAAVCGREFPFLELTESS